MGDKSCAKQSFKDECDINNILKQYQKTGVINHVKENAGQYVDLPEVPDYQEAMNLVIAAGGAFDSLPGSVRQRFNNNAVTFLDFMNDEENMAESIQLGLRESPDPPEGPETGNVELPPTAAPEVPVTET